MGSSGSGKFGNYKIGGGVDGDGQKSGGGSGSSGNGNEINCPTLIENINLEDVGTSEFFVNNNAVPNKSSQVEIRNCLVNGRLVVELSSSHEIIGNLPTDLNYLLTCLKSMRYTGIVVAAGLSPIPFTVVTVNA